ERRGRGCAFARGNAAREVDEQMRVLGRLRGGCGDQALASEQEQQGGQREAECSQDLPFHISIIRAGGRSLRPQTTRAAKLLDYGVVFTTRTFSRRRRSTAGAMIAR